MWIEPQVHNEKVNQICVQIILNTFLCLIEFAWYNGGNGRVSKLWIPLIWHSKQAQANAQSIWKSIPGLRFLGLQRGIRDVPFPRLISLQKPLGTLDGVLVMTKYRHLNIEHWSLRSQTSGKISTPKWENKKRSPLLIQASPRQWSGKWVFKHSLLFNQSPEVKLQQSQYSACTVCWKYI